MFAAFLGQLKRRFVASCAPARRQLASRAGVEDMRILLELAIDKSWSSNFEVTQDFRVGFVKDIAGDMREEGLRILAGADPIMRNREALVSRVASMEQLDVLVVSSAADPDSIHFRQAAISGELKPLILALWKVDDGLRNLIEPVEKTIKTKWDDLWNPILLKYRVLWAWANLHNSLRVALCDGDPWSADDWFRPGTPFVAR